MGRGSEVRRVPREEARTYLAKAKEFSAGAVDDLEQGRWNAAGLSAIHAGICAADAVVIASGGVRSASRDHGSALHLLKKTVPSVPAAHERQLTGLLGMKNAVEYESRLLRESESKTLVEQSGRLVKWAGEVVAEQLG